MKIKEKIRKAIITYALEHYPNEFLTQPKNVRRDTVRVETVQAVTEMPNEVFKSDDTWEDEYGNQVSNCPYCPYNGKDPWM